MLTWVIIVDEHTCFSSLISLFIIIFESIAQRVLIIRFACLFLFKQSFFLLNFQHTLLKSHVLTFEKVNFTRYLTQAVVFIDALFNIETLTPCIWTMIKDKVFAVEGFHKVEGKTNEYRDENNDTQKFCDRVFIVNLPCKDEWIVHDKVSKEIEKPLGKTIMVNFHNRLFIEFLFWNNAKKLLPENVKVGEEKWNHKNELFEQDIIHVENFTDLHFSISVVQIIENLITNGRICISPNSIIFLFNMIKLSLPLLPIRKYCIVHSTF